MPTKTIKENNLTLMGATSLNLQVHPAEHLWRVPSAALRKYWAPVIGPAAVHLYEVIFELTQHGPIDISTEDLGKRVGISAGRVNGAVARLAGVFGGDVTQSDDDKHVNVSIPEGVCPPSYGVRRRTYPERLHKEFDDYLQDVGVSLVEAGLGSVPMTAAGLD